MYTTGMPGARERKRALDLLELVLKVAVNYNVGAGKSNPSPLKNQAVQLRAKLAPQFSILSYSRQGTTMSS